MARTNAKASRKVGKVTHEFEHGTLRSGVCGKWAKNPKQAVAIGWSETRKQGA